MKAAPATLRAFRGVGTCNQGVIQLQVTATLTVTQEELDDYAQTGLVVTLTRATEEPPGTDYMFPGREAEPVTGGSVSEDT